MARKENLNPTAGLTFGTPIEVKKVDVHDIQYVKEDQPTQRVKDKNEIQRESPAEISKPTNDILVQKAYYITVNQYRELKLRAALGDEKDMSAIVRSALDAYFSQTNNKSKKA